MAAAAAKNRKRKKRVARGAPSKPAGPVTSLAQTALDDLFRIMEPHNGLAANGGTEAEMPTAYCDTIDRFTAQSSGAFGDPSKPMELATLLTDQACGSRTEVLCPPESARLVMGGVAYLPGHVDSQTLYANQAEIFATVGTGRCRQMASWLVCELSKRIATSDDPRISGGVRVAYCSFLGRDHAFVALLNRTTTTEGQRAHSPVLFLDPWQAAMQPTAAARAKHAGRKPFKDFKAMLTGLRRQPCLSAINHMRHPRLTANPDRYQLLAIGGGPSGLRTCRTPTASAVGDKPAQAQLIQFACGHALPVGAPTRWCRIAEDPRTGSQTLHPLAETGLAFPKVLRRYSSAELARLPARMTGDMLIFRRSAAGFAPYGYSGAALTRLMESDARAAGGGAAKPDDARAAALSSARHAASAGSDGARAAALSSAGHAAPAGSDGARAAALSSAGRAAPAGPDGARAAALSSAGHAAPAGPDDSTPASTPVKETTSPPAAKTTHDQTKATPENPCTWLAKQALSLCCCCPEEDETHPKID